jgi:peroxiredoxin
MLKVEDKAPDFRLPAADGREVQLSALLGKPV